MDSFQDDNPKAEAFESPKREVFATFRAMALNRNLLHGVDQHGFETPSAVQQRAIVPFINGEDLIVQARSGTGKTGALAIGILQRVSIADWKRERTCQAVCLAPTRELVLQTCDAVSSIGKYLCISTFCSTFIGATRDEPRRRVVDGRALDDVRKLQLGVLVAVGIPGRVYDLMKRGALRTNSLKVLCLDAADEMLTQGYSEPIYEMFKLLAKKDVQVCLISATMPAEVREFAAQFMRDPAQILVESGGLGLKGVKQLLDFASRCSVT